VSSRPNRARRSPGSSTSPSSRSRPRVTLTSTRLSTISRPISRSASLIHLNRTRRRPVSTSASQKTAVEASAVKEDSHATCRIVGMIGFSMAKAWRYGEGPSDNTTWAGTLKRAYDIYRRRAWRGGLEHNRKRVRDRPRPESSGSRCSIASKPCCQPYSRKIRNPRLGGRPIWGRRLSGLWFGSQ
jgi:hypothetical protein